MVPAGLTQHNTYHPKILSEHIDGRRVTQQTSVEAANNASCAWEGHTSPSFAEGEIIVSSYHLLNHVHLELRLRSFCSRQFLEVPSVVPIQMSVLSRILEVIPILHIRLLPGRLCIEALPSTPSSSSYKLNPVRSPSIQPLHIYFVGSLNLSFCFFR